MKPVKFAFLLVALLGLVLVAPAVQNNAAKPGAYHLIKKIALGGEGGWDYLTMDPQSRLLYVTHATQVEVINVDTGVKGEPITGLSGVHGVAIAAELGRGYVSNGRTDCVSIFDLKTGKVTGTVATGKNPDAIVYDSGLKRVFVFNGSSHDATVIDAATNQVAGTVALGGKPEFAAVDAKGTVFVNIEDQNEIAVFDGKSLQVKAHWPIKPGEEASGLALDGKNRRIFCVCGNDLLVVVNADNGAVVTTLPIGKGADAVKYDAVTGLIFSSNGDGTLTIVKQESADTYAILATATTAPRARTMALDPKTHHVFLATAEFGKAPEPTKEQPRPRPPVVPGSFYVLELGQ
jgi:YVTN family beta-propeller protein